MAGVAGGWRECENIVVVTIRALEWFKRSRKLVAVQGEPHCLMRKGIQIFHDSERRICPAVLGMTIPAGQAGIMLKERPVQRAHVTHLSGDFHVTVEAAIRHPCRFPRRGVTGLALTPGFGMGGHAAQRSATLRAQLSRTVQQAAASVGIACDNEGSDQGGKDSGSRQAARTTIWRPRAPSRGCAGRRHGVASRAWS